MRTKITSIEKLQKGLAVQDYVADRGLATAIYLALKLQRPLFLEGQAGVGKTEVAKVLAKLLEAKLIRLQCYEGLDVHHAVYEWNYSRQMLHIRLHEREEKGVSEEELFGPEFLLRRPLLQAIQGSSEEAPVLLIDEIDRSDAEFEAYLLEVLSDYQVTIPEIGTIKAQVPPIAVITSNRTREVHEALKRRCIYHWIDYPSFEKELEIITKKVPGASKKLSEQVTRFVQELRGADLYKIPGVAETLDWASALVALDQKALRLELIDETLGVLLKYHDDIETIKGETVSQIYERAEVAG